MTFRSNLFLINFYTFCVGTLFILPVLVPYYQDQLGLGFRELMIGEALFAIVVISMEVPSGWLSDVWSRKGTLIIGCITAIIGYSCLLFAKGLWGALLAQAILGVGVACNSGTVTSILYDSLAANNNTIIYQRLEGKRHAIGLYAVATAAIIGGIAYSYNTRLPLMLDIITLFFGLIAVCFIQEPKRYKRKTIKNPFSDMIVTLRYALHGHKEIAGIILVSTILFCSTKMIMWTQQPYMQFVAIPTEYFGYVIASGFLFGGLCGHLGHSITTNISNKTMIKLLILVPVFTAALAIIFPVPLSIVCILLVSGVYGYGMPFIQNAINNHADSARRATILSSMGLLFGLAFIPSSFILGWIVENFTILEGLLYILVQLVLLATVGLWMWTRATKDNT